MADAILNPTAELLLAKDAFQKHLLALAPVPYDVDPTIHAQMVSEHVERGLVTFFPMERAKPKKNEHGVYDKVNVIK